MYRVRQASLEQVNLYGATIERNGKLIAIGMGPDQRSAMRRAIAWVRQIRRNTSAIRGKL